MDDVARCAGPGCARPLDRPATGRPARYCGDNCRQAAHREKVRAAQAERDRAGQLAAAKAATARLWRPLEEAGFRDVAGRAALVVSCATDPARPRRELDQALAGLHHAAANLASLARQYRKAAELAARPKGGRSSWRPRAGAGLGGRSDTRRDGTAHRRP